MNESFVSDWDHLTLRFQLVYTSSSMASEGYVLVIPPLSSASYPCNKSCDPVIWFLSVCVLITKNSMAFLFGLASLAVMSTAELNQRMFKQLFTCLAFLGYPPQHQHHERQKITSFSVSSDPITATSRPRCLNGPWLPRIETLSFRTRPKCHRWSATRHRTLAGTETFMLSTATWYPNSRSARFQIINIASRGTQKWPLALCICVAKGMATKGSDPRFVNPCFAKEHRTRRP